MANVTIGRLTISEGSEQPQWGYAPEPDPSDRPVLFADAAQAETAYGEEIKRASATPDGFSLSAVEVLRSDALRIAVSVYRRPNQGSYQIEQSAIGESDGETMVVPPSGLRPVSVRSLPAAAWTVELPPPLLRASTVNLAFLAWEEDGNRFLATSTCLTEDDLLSVAQSL